MPDTKPFEVTIALTFAGKDYAVGDTVELTADQAEELNELKQQVVAK